MEYNTEIIGKRIATQREKHGLTQKNLGEKIGVVGKQVSNYESGKVIPPTEVLLKLCAVFDCELGYLLGEPCYAEGSVLETLIYNDTGISPAAIKVLRRITGKTSDSPHLGYEWEGYRSMLNQLILSPEFGPLINCLYDLHSAYKKSESFFSVIRHEVGNEQYKEGLALWREVEGLPNDDFPKLSNDQIELLQRLSDAENKSYNQEFVIKLMRYELHNSFESFVESLYPRGRNG